MRQKESRSLPGTGMSGTPQTNPALSMPDMTIDVNTIDSLAVLANETLHLASRSGRRSDARAAVYLHRAVYFAWLAIEELSEGVTL
jgi:hypothetical protein